MSTDSSEIVTEEAPKQTYQDILVGPQAGPQELFVGSRADICFYGGSAGAGKTFGILLSAAQHLDVPGYGAIIFRRTKPEIENQGGLWDESMGLYSLPGMDGMDKDGIPRGGLPFVSDLDWNFPNRRASIGFRAIQYEKDLNGWQGSQIPFIGFDEVTTFTRSIFFFMNLRNRSACGVDSYIRATCNPVPEDDPIGGWVHQFLQWWIDPETGFYIPERANATRWVIIQKSEFLWGDSKEELIEMYGNPELPEGHEDQVKPKSVQFIPGKLSDNKAMNKINPGYRASLEMLDDHLRQRMLEGNWNAKQLSGTFFKIGKCEIVDEVPANLTYCRGWDLAATDGAGDFTAGPKMGVDPNGVYYIVDQRRGRWETFARDEIIKTTAAADGYECQQRFPEDPGGAGKSEGARIQRMLRGYYVTLDSTHPTKGNKAMRARGLQSQFNAGNVKMLRAPWNGGLLQRMDAFETKGVPDDEIDGLSTSFSGLSRPKPQAALGTSDNEKKEEPDHTRQFHALISDYVREFWEKIVHDEEAVPKWKDSFASFKNDMGERPSDAHKIQRIKPLDFFGPENCYWGIDGQEPPVKRHFAALGTS